MISKYFKKKVRFATYQKYAISTSLTQTNNTEDLVIFSNLDELSTKMIEKLPHGQRQVFMMKNIENLSAEEIAEKLNISRRTVENQAYRASKWLREKLAL